jgi:hypothetical protein
MQRVVDINGKSLSLTVSRVARDRLERLDSPLLLEMELYFSCLVRKRVYVREGDDVGDMVAVSDNLWLRFRPVVTERCVMREVDTANPPVKDMPMENPERFFPHWLTVDYSRGEWLAEFGYHGAHGPR